MKIPRKVLIDGMTWSIVCSKQRPKWAPADADGACDKSQRRIWVCQQACDEETLSCLVHEFMHAVLCSGAVSLSYLYEEIAVAIAEPALYSLLRDNDMFFLRRK